MKVTERARNDQVFQLSLTEIAFTVSFILLLLLGYLVFREQADRKTAQAALRTAKSAEQLIQGLEGVKQEIDTALRRAGQPQARETITKLIEAETLRQENQALLVRLRDLDAKLTALVELQKLTGNGGSEEDRKAMRDSVATAVAFQAAAKKVVDELQALSRESKDGDRSSEQQGQALKNAFKLLQALSEQSKQQLGQSSNTPEQIAAIISDAKRYRDALGVGTVRDAMQKENSDLRGQVAFLKNRLDARGGRDYPPCWADENGKIEFLFVVETKPDGVVVSPYSWSPRRAEDAAALPGLQATVAKVHTHSEFPAVVAPILQWSRKQNPECRHYVVLRSSISDAVSSDRARLMVENFFYKHEVLR